MTHGPPDHTEAHCWLSWGAVIEQSWSYTGMLHNSWKTPGSAGAVLANVNMQAGQKQTEQHHDGIHDFQTTLWESQLSSLSHVSVVSITREWTRTRKHRQRCYASLTIDSLSSLLSWGRN